MEIKCKKCGEVIVIADDTVPGQHIRCPYCSEKFAYAVEKVGISDEDLRTALAECRKDKELNAYYRNAPQGARLYIALVFYGKVFRDELDKDAYVKAFAEIGDELKERDLRYLLQYEDDESMREYLSDRLAALVGRSDIPVQTGDSEGCPRLGIIRSPEPKTTRANPEIERRMAMQERNEKFRAQAEEREWRRKLVGMVVNGAIICAVLIVGWIVYSAWHDRQVQARREHLEEIRAEEVRSQERAEKEKLERDRRDAEERARRDRERTERLERERKEREERRRIAAEDAERQKKIDEENRLQEEAEQRREEYRDALETLKDRELFREDSLPVQMRLGRAMRKFLCVVPAGQDGFNLFEVANDGKGQPKAVLLSEEKGRESVDFKELEKRIGESGCIFYDDEKAYFRPGQLEKKDDYPIPEEGKDVSPWDDVFGQTLAVIKNLNLDCESFALDVFLRRKGEDDVKVARLDPFESVAVSQIKEMMHQVLLEEKIVEALKKPLRIKKPKITVELYDGDIIQKNASGVTRVPRVFRKPNGYTGNFEPYYHSWSDGRRCNCNQCKNYREVAKAHVAGEHLYNEAVKQGLLLADYEEEVEKAKDKIRDSVKVYDKEVVNALRKTRVLISPATEKAEEVFGTGAIANKLTNGRKDRGSVADELSAAGIARLNARLKYKSFCGVEFGTVEGRINESNGRGGDLQTAFRHFKSYTKWGSKVFHRVAKIDLSGKIANASIDSFKKEIRQTVAVLSKKYGVTFNVVEESDERCEMRFEDQYVKIVVCGYYSNGEASFSIGFTNKQVDEQNDEIWARHPGEDISMPGNTGIDVL